MNCRVEQLMKCRGDVGVACIAYKFRGTSCVLQAANCNNVQVACGQAQSGQRATRAKSGRGDRRRCVERAARGERGAKLARARLRVNESPRSSGLIAE